MEGSSMTIRIKLLTAFVALGVAISLGVGVAPSEASTSRDLYKQPGQSFVSPPGTAQVVEREEFTAIRYTVVVWPVPASTAVSSAFGWRTTPYWGDHQGVDLTPGAGAPVRAVAKGTVSYAGCSGGLGCHVVVEHVIDGVPTQTTYGHMQFGSITVSQGQGVAFGQVVGRVGSTGASTGNHLHFEVHVGGAVIDPYTWIITHRTD